MTPMPRSGPALNLAQCATAAPTTNHRRLTPSICAAEGLDAGGRPPHRLAVQPRLFALVLLVLLGVAWIPPATGWCAGPAASSAVQPAPEPVYSLQSVLDLALARNPTVASAEGTIEQNRGQQVAAYTYLNPSV
ncbi:MAG: hypothetical protein GDA68_12785, partial [Nitrospira sp. CR2.1]|nr:hypothetical protein [Nitrospira sp. CR2.1]